MTFASTVPRAKAAPATAKGFGPSFVRLRRPTCGPDGAWTAVAPGSASFGASPFARATISDGFSLRRKRRVVGELVRQLSREPTLGRGADSERLELVRARFDCLVAGRHRFAGGFSPVATRQMPDAARLAAIVATAPSAP